MQSQPGRERSALLDLVYNLHAARQVAELAPAGLPGMLQLIGADRIGWLTLDRATSTIEGQHYPEPISHLLRLMPRDLYEVPLAADLLDRPSFAVTTISDQWPAREWRRQRIYQELYRPHGARFLMQVPVAFDDGRVQSIALSRGTGNRDFSAADRAMLAQFGRHLRQAYRALHLRAGTVADSAARHGLTRRQGEALQAVADGATMPVAARRLGIAPKTLENHLQEAYRRLGVASRLAALDRLRSD